MFLSIAKYYVNSVCIYEESERETEKDTERVREREREREKEKEKEVLYNLDGKCLAYPNSMT